MKLLKILGVCALLTMSGQSFAQTVPIKFAKGSECGSYSGNFAGKKFTLHLGAGQELLVETPSDEIVRSVVVKNPQGRSLGQVVPDVNHDTGELLYQWTIKNKGQHSVTIISHSRNNAFGDIKFCAY